MGFSIATVLFHVTPPTPLTLLHTYTTPLHLSPYRSPLSPIHNSQNPRFCLHFPSTSPLHGVSLRNPNFRVRASAHNSQTAPSNTRLVILCSAVSVILAVANRVFYKLALVPLKQYPFFLAQFTTFGYVSIYFSILYMRYRAGIVTDEMIALPKSPFLAIGILEAIGVASGMASAAMLPGPAIPLLNQTFLAWQLALSTLFLGRKYSFSQILGCFLVVAGVVTAVGRSVKKSCDPMMLESVGSQMTQL